MLYLNTSSTWCCLFSQAEARKNVSCPKSYVSQLKIFTLYLFKITVISFNIPHSASFKALGNLYEGAHAPTNILSSCSRSNTSLQSPISSPNRSSSNRSSSNCSSSNHSKSATPSSSTSGIKLPLCTLYRFLSFLD